MRRFLVITGRDVEIVRMSRCRRRSAIRILLSAIPLVLAALPCAAEVQQLLVDPMADAAHWQVGGRRINYTLGASALVPSREQPREGEPAALKLICDFGERRRDYLSAYWVGEAIPGRCREISFWLHGSACGCRLRLSLEDARGRWFQRDLGPVDWQGWRQVRAAVGDGKEWQFLGRRGETRLPVLHPVALKQIALFRHPVRGEEPANRLEMFFLSDLRAEADAEALDFVTARLDTGRPANLFNLGEVPALEIALAGDPKRTVDGRLSVVVSDFLHRKRTLDLGEVSLPAGGSQRRQARIPTDRQGVYEVRLVLRAGDRERAWFGRFAVVRPLPQRPPDAGALFGNQFNLHEFPAGQKATVARLNRDAGIRWTRQGFGWQSLNPAEGVWAWDGPRRADGPSGKALSLLGEAVGRPHAAALNCTDAVALAFWARAQGSTGGWQFPMTKWGAANRRNYGAYFHQTTGTFHFTASFTGTPSRGWTDWDSGFRAWDGQWHHYAATYSAQAKQVVLYVDGTARRTHDCDGGALCTNEEDLRLGSGFPGALDEVLLYRRALSPAEVAGLAAKSPPPADGLVGWWAFDEPGPALKDRSPNHLDFPAGETAAGTRARYSLEHGQKVLGLLGFPPLWASTAPPGASRPWVYKPKLEAWAAFVEQTTRHYEDLVQHWELWNEPNIDVFWEPKPDAKEFFDVVRVGYEAAKRGNPKCTVIMPGLAGPGDGGWGMPFLDDLLKMGAARYCDAIAIHPYRQSTPEESDLVGDLRHISDLAAAHGGRRRIWYTEECWTTHIPGGSTEERQAQMLARAYVLSLASGFVERLIWFRLHDSGADRFYTEDNYGMCYGDLTPKPAWFAQRTLATLLDGGVPEGVWNMGPQAMARCFRVRGERVAAVWAPSGTAPAALYTGRPSVRVIDLMGNERAIASPGGVLLLDATENVLFLRGLAKDAGGRGTPLALQVRPLVRGAKGVLSLRVRNPFPTPQRVALALAWPEGTPPSDAGPALPAGGATEAPGAAGAPARPAAAPGHPARVPAGASRPPATPAGPGQGSASSGGPEAIGLAGVPASLVLPANSTRVVPLVAIVAADAEPGWHTLRATLSLGGRSIRQDLPVPVCGAAPDAGPAGRWNLDEGQGDVIHDASPNANHGSVDSPRWVSGRRGSALQFDGQHIAVIPDAPSLNLGDAVTLALWLKPLGDTGTWQFPVTKYFQENIRRNYGLYLAPKTLAPAFSASFARGDYAHTDIGASVPLAPGEWHHLAATYSLLEKRVRVYVDGKPQVDHALDCGAMLLTNDPVRLGTGTVGVIDDVVVYPRALSPAEVARLAGE